MNSKEIGIIFNRADQYRRAAFNANPGTARYESFSRKYQAVYQVIKDLGLEYTYNAGREVSDEQA